MQEKFSALRTMNSFVLVQFARTIAPRTDFASKANVPAMRDTPLRIVLSHLPCWKITSAFKLAQKITMLTLIM